MSRLSVVAAMACALLLAACQPAKSPLPGSTVRPYEVIVVGDVDSSFYDVLSVPVPGLPQREPMFDVRLVGAADFEGKLRLMRNLLVVRADRKWAGRPSVRYERNRYAQPQLVVYADVGSAEELRDLCAAHGRQIRQMFVVHECGAAVQQLARKHHANALKMVDTMFQHSLLIPTDMGSYKKGKDFLWLSNDAAQGMQNICVYALPGLAAPSPERIDSVLRVNMRGETDQMYMQTVRPSVQTDTIGTGEHLCQIQRGLWEMAGDAMGGPLVRRVLKDSVGNRTLVIDGFVYAPGEKKRNRLREIEAALLTMKRNK